MFNRRGGEAREYESVVGQATNNGVGGGNDAIPLGYKGGIYMRNELLWCRDGIVWSRHME